MFFLNLTLNFYPSLHFQKLFKNYVYFVINSLTAVYGVEKGRFGHFLKKKKKNFFLFVYWKPFKREGIKNYCISVKFHQSVLEVSLKTIAVPFLDNLFLSLFFCVCFKTFQSGCFYLRHVICRILKYIPVL